MQALTPMSRDAMRELTAKVEVEEDARLQGIKQRVASIYHQAVTAAQNSTETSFKMEVPKMDNTLTTSHMTQHHLVSDPFYIENMTYILCSLQHLFPGCKVSHTLLSQGTDGKFYDISSLDDKILPFVNKALDQSFIVIDWS